jgi:hypothetical protein
MDPGSGAFLTPGSGILEGKKSRAGIWNEQYIPNLIFDNLVLVFGLKYLNSLMRIRIWDPGSCQPCIRDPGWKKSYPGSGKTSRIRNTAEKYGLDPDPVCFLM